MNARPSKYWYGLEKKRAFPALFFPFLGVLLLSAIFLLQYLEVIDTNFWALHPRNLSYWYTPLTFHLLHGDWMHLFSNSSALIVLGAMLIFFYYEIALDVFLWIWFATGISTWMLAQSGIHLGASGILYGIAFFLALSGFLRKNPRLGFVTLLVIFLYGSLIWGLIPGIPAISWEGHLAGAASGIFAALYFRKEGPQQPLLPPIDESDLDDSDPYWMEGADQFPRP